MKNKEVKEKWLGIRTENTRKECKQSGIYAIKNIKNNKLYIGSTMSEFYTRWSSHSYHMRNNSHHNYFLQKDWDKNKKLLVYEILECIDKDKPQSYFFEREQFYIDDLKTVFPDGYNISAIAGEFIFNRKACNAIIKREDNNTEFRISKRNNLFKDYLRLNDMANETLKYDLKRSQLFNDKEIEAIVWEGLPLIFKAYKKVFKSNKSWDIFKYCMINLKHNMPVGYKSREYSFDRSNCSICVYHDKNYHNNGYDFCYYYNTYLPPIDVGDCKFCMVAKNKSEADLIMFFNRRHIDDVIEDYLKGRDYSSEEAIKWHERT